MVEKSFGTTFHRTFSFDRSIVSKILTYQNFSPLRINQKDLVKMLKIGTAKADAYPKYGVISGLLDSITNQPTIFGKQALIFDPLFQNISTQWIIQYHFCNPRSLAPIFWHKFVAERFILGRIFTRSELEDFIQEIYFLQEDALMIRRHILSTAHIFIKSYLDTEGLSQINLLKQFGEGNNYEIIGQPLTDPWVFGYALTHYKETIYPDKATLNIQDIIDSALARIFLLSPPEAEAMLEALRVEGFLEIHRTLPPYQVLLRKTGEFALQKVYGE